jgi:hypothetical protein
MIIQHSRHPPSNKVRNELRVPFVLPKDLSVDLHMQIFVGYENATQYHVIEQTRVLPTFSMYFRVEPKQCEPPKSYATFNINERVQRVILTIYYKI